MQSAIWSQPTCSSQKKKNRCHQNSHAVDAPNSAAAKTVLAVGISQCLIGGLLMVLGLTGYFVKDFDKKSLLGSATFFGLSSIVCGASACKSISWDRAKSCTNFFTFFTFINVICSAILIGIDIFIVSFDQNLLLVKVLAYGEMALSVINLLVSILGSTVAILGRDVLQNPLGGD